jgi:hypothetical protein
MESFGPQTSVKRREELVGRAQHLAGLFGFDFSKWGRSVPNSFNSRFDRIGRIVLLPFHKSELPYDALLELPNRIGSSPIGDLSSKLAHLLLDSIAINQGSLYLLGFLTRSRMTTMVSGSDSSSHSRSAARSSGASFWIPSWILAKFVISEPFGNGRLPRARCREPKFRSPAHSVPRGVD